MSSSELYVLNNDLKVGYVQKFINSWRFTPPLFAHLVNKYTTLKEKEDCIKKYSAQDKEKPFNLMNTLMEGEKFYKEINLRINKSGNITDRIGWEIINQQCFLSKDKDIVADSIMLLQKDLGDFEDRFKEIAEKIKDIDIEKYPYFIFKNTTVDDGVERYFEGYDEENDEVLDVGLRETDLRLCFDVVLIDNGNMSFASPYEYFDIEEKE